MRKRSAAAPEIQSGSRQVGNKSTARVALSPSPTDEAFAAVWSADYHRALALLHNVDLPGCASMRARVWLRLGRYDRVIDEFNRLHMSNYDAQEGVQVCGFAATAFALVNDFDRAVELLSKASGIAKRAGDPVLLAFCSYTHARVGIFSGNVEIVDEPLRKAREILENAREYESEPGYFLELPTARAHLCDAESWRSAARADYVAHEKILLEAAASVVLARNIDRFLEASILSNLAALVSRLPLENAQRYLSSCVKGMEWTNLTDESETRIRRALLSYSRMFGRQGDSHDVWEHGAASLVSRFGICVDALLFDNWSNRSKYFAELRFAISIALDLRWDAKSGSELFDLIALVPQLAPFDLMLASRMSEIYEQFSPALPVIHYPIHDPRTLGMKHFADGCLAKANGNLEVASVAFAKSISSSASEKVSGIHAICGLERYSISRDAKDLSPAREFVSEYRSSLSQRLSSALVRIEECRPSDFPYLGMYGSPNNSIELVG